MLVFANPIAGREAEFNDWYTSVHMGDLLQLEGWVGAQRFRIVPGVTPRFSKEGYRQSYLIIWDQEEESAAVARERMSAAIKGGKSRLGAGFNYQDPEAVAGATYRVLGPRIARPDGKRAFMPDAADNRTPRPNRYIAMDFATPLPGKETLFAAAWKQRIAEILALPGWMAAQQFSYVPSRGRKPDFLTLWEIEASSAQAAHDVLVQAINAGKVTALQVDESTAEYAYWEPLTPYVTKDDIQR